MGRVTAIHATCGVQKMACLLVGVQWVGAECFLQPVVCKKMAYMLVDVKWAELEQFIQNVVCHKMAF